jgi:hypothetical protein
MDVKNCDTCSKAEWKTILNPKAGISFSKSLHYVDN